MRMYYHPRVYLFVAWILKFMQIAVCKCCQCEKDNFIIPKDYNKNIAPTEAEGKPTFVYVSLDIMDIDEITEEKMEFSMQFYVNEYWKDARLNVSFSSKAMQIPREVVSDMWTPDIIFENSKGGWVYQLAIPNIVVQTHHFGYFHRFTRYNMKISCSMYLQSYPMDTQKCYLSITSLASDKSTMDLRWLHERTKDEKVQVPDLNYSNIHPLKYSVTKVTTSKHELQDNSLGVTWNALRSNFIFVRHLSSHLFNVYIPSALVVVLSFMSFWLNIRSVPARVALGLTSLLTLSTQASQARTHLPPINYLTAMDVWLFSCILHVFMSLIEYAIVYHWYSSKIRAKAVSSCKTYPEKNSRCLIKSHLIENRLNKPKPETTISTPKMGADFDEEIQLLDKISRVLFPLSFVIFAFAYWIRYL